MYTLTIAFKNVFSQVIAANIFMEGGPLFMSLILICLLASLAFIVVGFMRSKSATLKARKFLKLAVDASLLGLVLGFLGSVIGLISAFDSVEAMGNPNPAIFAGGLKVSLLTATFGLFSFVVGRIGIMVLRLVLPSEDSLE
ncbi:MotA/TolQ/ExbB proton channel family protein [Psychroserpens algicola]|uniref:MotA/TolQ/ExbB proton channel family protein n=1 Tax=Psychroserpens algicola TaxID=1719034 RepID=UPI0019535127|nr:MotA/TolQ/ExbB proton channel family protein [Psychroserpens algicola]